MVVLLVEKDLDDEEGWEMVKLVYCLKKRSDLSDEEFHDYWLNKHAPLVREQAPALKIKRYSQFHTMPLELHEAVKEARGLGDYYDGTAELWWESLDALLGAYSSPEGMEANAILGEDEARFIDFAGSCMFLTEEHAIIEE